MDILNYIAEKLNVATEDVSSEMLDKVAFVPKEEFELISNNKLDLEGSKVILDKKEVEISQLQEGKLELQKKLDSLIFENSQLKEEGTELSNSQILLKQEVEFLKPKAKRADDVLGKRVEYAIEMYSKSVSGNTDELLIDEIKNETSFEKLEAKIKMFGGKSLNSFGAKCKKCGDSDIEFRSSVEINAVESEDKKEKSSTFVNKVLNNRS